MEHQMVEDQPHRRRLHPPLGKGRTLLRRCFGEGGRRQPSSVPSDRVERASRVPPPQSDQSLDPSWRGNDEAEDMEWEIPPESRWNHC
jgi:hypothetical protein